MVNATKRVGVYNPPLEPAEGNAIHPTFSFSKSWHTTKSTWTQRLISVRVLLLVTFAFQVFVLGGVSLAITSYSTTSVSKDLSSKILDNVILRVADEIDTVFYKPYAAAAGSWFQLPKNANGMTYETLQPILWDLWRQYLTQFVDLYLCTVPEGDCFGYCIFPTQYNGSRQSLQIYLNKTENNAQIILPVVNEEGTGNFSDVASMLILPNYTIQDNPWWYPFIAEQQLGWTDVYYDDAFPEFLFFSIVYPIVDPKTNATVGMLGIDITSAALLELLTDIVISKHAQIWIIQPTGLLVASSDPDEVTNKDAGTGLAYAQDSNLDLVRESTTIFLQQLNEGKTSDQFSYKLHGESIVMHSYYVAGNGLNLYLLVAYPQSDFLSEVSYYERVSIAVSASALVFSILVGLGAQMDLISGGLFDVTKNLYPTKLFELYSLQQDFTRMVKALKSFGRYVPVDIVRYLLRNNTEAEAVVTQKDLTVMFSDIKGFTQMVEDMSPAQLSLLLTDYLNSMCAIIGENYGTIDKFIGDAIMALWNVPTSIEDHTFLACNTALQSLKELQHLNVKWASMSLPRVDFRIGIHTGKALVGNVGSKERLAFTAIGDNINLASRLESLNKRYGEVHQIVRHKYLCRFLDVVVVVGRSAHTHIYELLGTIEESTAQQVALCRTQADALTCFLNKDFEEALSLYASIVKVLPDDLSIKMLMDRASKALQNFQLGSLPEDWTGYFFMDEK